jgi:hypothetical protein
MLTKSKQTEAMIADIQDEKGGLRLWAAWAGGMGGMRARECKDWMHQDILPACQ